MKVAMLMVFASLEILKVKEEGGLLLGEKLIQRQEFLLLMELILHPHTPEVVLFMKLME